jgi:uncharacterized membrane protein
MRSALTVIRWLLAAAILTCAALITVPLLAPVLGYDRDATKWPVLAAGGLIIVVGGLLSIVAICLQIAISLRARYRRSSN